MKWAVVGVKPEPHDRLFVRFGEIDLAPDATYVQIVTERGELQKVS